MEINEYIDNILTHGFFRGDLEISISSNIYNINIVTYNEVWNDGDHLIALTPIRYINNENNENLHLLILTNINNLNFRIGYYKNNSILYKNFKIDVKYSKNDNSLVKNKQEESSEKETENPISKISLILENINNMDLPEIIKLYEIGHNKKIGLEDIYLYLYHLNLNKNEKGKYSEKFKQLYKKKNYKFKKLEFRKNLKNIS